MINGDTELAQGLELNKYVNQLRKGACIFTEVEQNSASKSFSEVKEI
jgi:hypothetical protein